MQLWSAYSLLVAAYREAAEKLRAGSATWCSRPELPASVAVRGWIGRWCAVSDLREA